MRLVRSPVWIAALLALGAAAPAHRLTFEDRVRDLETLERFRYAHQIGARRPFEEAVPRALLEKKVRTTLQESAVLASLWNTPIQGDRLRRELERIAAETRMPDRLREMYALLGNDPLRIQESLARPTLADRLARNFFAYDERIHAPSRREAERLREDLASGRLNPRAAHPRRDTVEMMRVEPAEPAVSPEETLPPAGDGTSRAFRLRLSPEDFEQRRTGLPARTGVVGPLRENRDDFVVQVVLDASPDSITVANYVTPKRSWDEWWAGVASRLDERALAEEVPAAGPLPLPRSDASAGGPASSCPAGNEWDSMLKRGDSGVDAPLRRYGHPVVWTGNLMIVWGGQGQNAPQGSGGRYDPATDTWMPVSTIGAPSSRTGHSAVWTGGSMIVWGGTDFSGATNTGARYDPATDTWIPLSAIDAPAARSGHSAVWTGTEMIVWGGAASASVFLQTGGRYDPTADSWKTNSVTGAPSGRLDQTAVWTGSLMIVWGGFDGASSLLTGGRYDPVADTWSPTSISGLRGRRGHTAVWAGSVMIVWGGEDASGVMDDGAYYEPASDFWGGVSTIGAPSGRSRHTAVWSGTSMLVWGGTSGPGSRLKTGGRYDPFADAWTAIGPTNAPEGRLRHSAVWAGDQMIVWGGTDLLDALSSGGRYDPGGDGWTPTARDNAPWGRSGHSAVWTGNHMIVWGGFGQDGPFIQGTLHDGARYDPVLDAWTPLANGFLFGRSGHAAVWTGDRMIIWGGNAGSLSSASTGSRYDPIEDVWAPTSMTNAPPPRFIPTVVWSGVEMIVWGGAAPSNVNTGGRYNPLTDTWSPTSTAANVPQARSNHSAVWAGSVMVVWGGNVFDPITRQTIAVNTGGRYDPVTNTWTPTAIASAPTPRRLHTAVWTGDRMIVWGGSDTVSQLPNGGRYDPVTNAWTTMATPGVASEALTKTSLWTGERMLTWGGFDPATLSPTGARYDPVADTWSSLCRRNAPSARNSYTAVWTGTQMIVWGGQPQSGFAYLGDGGRYTSGPGVDADNDCVTECQGDCDDAVATVYPGAPELCDDLDNDCDGNKDGFATSCGVGSCASAGLCLSGVDTCVPGSPAPEICDGLDNNCDGVVDNPADDDHDGLDECHGDCDDANFAVRPGRPEQCDNLDNDCSGTIDGFPTICGIGACSSAGTCIAGVNVCVPGEPSAEVCDGIDNDCDGVVDDAPIPAGTPLVAIDPSVTAPTLAWEALSDATSYDVVFGDVGTLIATGGDFTAAVQGCVAFHLGGTSLPLGPAPAPGNAIFYLVRGVNCGGRGTYDSGGPGQVGSRDVEIDASPLGCGQCGDGACTGAETCGSCIADCGYCPFCTTDEDCQAADCCPTTFCIFVWETQSCSGDACGGCTFPQIGCGTYCGCNEGACMLTFY